MPDAFIAVYDLRMPDPDIDIETWLRDVRKHMLQLRDTRGLTQNQVAERMGTTQSRIANLESGRAMQLDLRVLVEWANALDARVTLTIEYDDPNAAGD